MVTTNATIDALNKLYDERKNKCERLRQQLSDAEKEMEAVGTTLKMLGFAAPTSALDLSQMTQIGALIAIANANGGVLAVKTARRMMVKAEMFKSPKNAASIIFTAITRSEKFVKLGSGKYRLKTEEEKHQQPVLIPTPVSAASMRDAIAFDLTPTSHPAKKVGF